MKAAIEQFFNSYIRAFENFDLQGVRQCYVLPCLLTTPDKVLSIESEQAFEQEFSTIFSSLKQAGFAQIGWRKASYYQHSNTLISVAVPWHFYDKNQQEFAAFTGIYQLLIDKFSISE
jgi:hypothetical protein